MNAPQRKGPLFHRFLIAIFSIAFGVLVFWLLGFILHDIDRIQGPDLNAMYEAEIDPSYAKKDRELERQIADTKAEIARLTKRQSILQAGIANSQRGIDQLQSLSKDKAAEAAEDQPNQAAMAENIRLFLADQRTYQELNQEIVDRNDDLESLEKERKQHAAVWRKVRAPVDTEYEQLRKRHSYRLAIYKLALLVPLLIAWGLLFRWYRGTYAPLIYAAGSAIAARIIQVIHLHFPERWFKYILTTAALLVVTGIVVYLLRMLKNPKREWLLDRYREAYEAFLCPVCDYPIRRGPLKYVSWTRRSIKKAVYRAAIPSDGTAEDAAYTCPICTTRLFEPCGNCESIRHSLLPACSQCGDVQEVA